uniref:C2H2-type domain-containing protein n=1 Tax=Paramormyrops kingsleyae TaxID=1676925 RepID=A0A3B3T1D1_9TELE
MADLHHLKNRRGPEESRKSSQSRVAVLGTLLQHQQAGCHVPGNVSCPPVPSLSTLPTTPQAPLVTPAALPDVSHAPLATQSSMLSSSCAPPLVIPVTSQAPPISPQAPEHSTRSPPIASTPPTPARLYFCSLCCREFRSQVGLASHQRLSHPGGKKFPCPSCDKVFCHSPSLSQHKLRCHGQRARQMTRIKGKEETVGASPHPKGRVFPCRSCDMVFSQTSSLQLHRKEQHRRPGGVYPCLYCSKVFGHHLTRRVQGRMYRCPRCGQAYHNHSNLIRHRCEYVKVLQRAARRQETCSNTQGSRALLASH